MTTHAGRLRHFRFLVAVVLLFSLMPLPSVAAVVPSGVRVLGSVGLQTNEPSLVRVAGADRLETSLAISQSGWTSSDVVLLASAENYPDALAGGPLAAALDAPILLTQSHELNEAVAGEIERLGATRVIVLGGPGAVGDGVIEDLLACGITPDSIDRIGGADRYETAVLIARRVISEVGGCDTVVVVTGENFPDALGASGVAGFFGWPILFVHPDSVPAATEELLVELAPPGTETPLVSTVVVGGEAAVSGRVLDLLPAATRIAGADRYATAAAVAEHAFAHGASYDHVFLATGLDFPDALGIAPLAAREGSPVVFTRPDALPAATDDFFMSHCSAIVDVTIVGGTGAVGGEVEAAVAYAATEIVNANAQEMDASTASLLESITPDGDMVFAGDSAQLDGLVYGAVLSSGPTTDQPDGLFRKVVGVTDGAGTVTVQTVQATLADVLVKGSVDVTGTPEEIPAQLPPAVDISAGTGFSLAVMADGTLWGWGINTEGQLGLGYADGTYVNRMTRIGEDADWRAVAAGWSYSFGIKQDGSLWAWGDNSSGRLGLDASVTQVDEPTLVSDAAWSQVVAYQGHAAGIREDGTLWTWGRNAEGQLGDGTRVDPWTLTQVGSDTDWAVVDVGDVHTVALKTDGSLWAWGSNFWGELGLGATVEVLAPVRVGTGLYSEVAAGHRHTLAIDQDGQLWGCGQNAFGSVGDGTQVDRSQFVRIGTDTDWSAVYAEGYASMALREDRTRWAWGKDLADGLGLETPGDRLVPTQGPEEFKWMELDIQMAGVLGTDMRGQLWAAGDNQYGQLADGTLVGRAALDMLLADEASLATLAKGDFTGDPSIEPAGLEPTGDMEPQQYIGYWWEGFVLRYYPDLNDWTFKSWALQNPSVYYGRYLEFDGHAKVDFSFYMNGSFDQYGMREMGMYLAVNEGLSLFVDTRAYGAYSGSILMWPIPKLHLATFGFFAGPVPVWFNVDLVVLSGLDGYFNAPAVHFRQEADRTIGFEWDRYSGFRQVNYGSNDNYCYAPHPLGTMSVKFWTSAELQTMMYGIIGPFVKFTGFGEVDANTAWNPWWKLELGLDGEIGAKLDFFDAIDETWSHTEPLIRWTVARAPGPFPY